MTTPQPTPAPDPRKRSRVLRWIPAAAWMAAIFAVSAVPGSSLPGGYSSPAHFLEYAVLCLLLLFALAPRSSIVTAALVAVLISSVYGITDEVHQAFVPMRTPDVADWVLDTAGAVSAAAAAAGLLLLRRTRWWPGGPDRSR